MHVLHPRQAHRDPCRLPRPCILLVEETGALPRRTHQLSREAKPATSLVVRTRTSNTRKVKRQGTVLTFLATTFLATTFLAGAASPVKNGVSFSPGAVS
jgi:hypothetical protein